MLTYILNAGHYVLSSIFPSLYADSFVEAAKIGDIQTITQMIAAGEDLSTKGNQALIEAARSGHLNVVDTLLGQAGVQANVNEDEPFRAAALHGHVSVMKRLFQEEVVNPASKQNSAIISASENGFLDAVLVLIKDKRVNPADMNNAAVRGAMAKGRAGVVQLLLKDDRVNPNAKQNEAVKKAARRNHDEVIFCLLDYIPNEIEFLKTDYPDVYQRYQLHCKARQTLGEILAQCHMPMDTCMHIAQYLGNYKHALRDLEQGYLIGYGFEVLKEKKAEEKACADLLPLVCVDDSDTDEELDQKVVKSCAQVARGSQAFDQGLSARQDKAKAIIIKV